MLFQSVKKSQSLGTGPKQRNGTGQAGPGQLGVVTPPQKESPTEREE